MAAQKPVLVSENVQRKEFVYALGNIKLAFTLRTDVKIELVGFRSMLMRALEDVDAELAKLKK